MKPGTPLPLIGAWLYRKQVRNLVRMAGDGDVTAVAELAAVFSSADDRRVRNDADCGLRSFPVPGQAGALCHEVLIRNLPALTRIALECGYLPSEPGERALFLFCTTGSAGNHLCGHEYSEQDLARGYGKADALLRARARDAARKNGSCDLLARVLCSPGMTGPDKWTYDEWEIIIAGLSQKGQWAELWHYLMLAPIPLAVTAITAMNNAGWTPPGDDRLVFGEIVAVLPDNWNYPSPSGEPHPAIGRAATQVSRVAFSPDGSLLAEGCCDGTIVIRGTALAGPESEILSGAGPAQFIMLSGDNRSLVSCGNDGGIRCHGIPDTIPVWSRQIGGDVTALCRSSDDRLLLAGDSRGRLFLLNPRDGGILRETALHPSPVTCIALSRDGASAACGHADGTVSVAGTGDERVRHLPAGSPDPVRLVAFGPDNRECLVMHDKALPVLWDTETGARLRSFSGHAGVCTCCAIFTECRWFAIGSSDHTLRFWDWREAVLATAIPLYNRHITCCSASPDGQYLAAGFNDGTIRLYSLPGHKLAKEIKGHKKTITSCIFSQDGNRLATVSWDGTTKLWRIPSGEIVRTFDAHAGGIAALAGPGEGSLIAPVTRDGIARVHDTGDGSLIRTIDLYTPKVRTAALSPDGMYLACAGADASLRIWNLRDGSLVSTAGRLGTSLWCSTFLAGGTSLFCGGWDGRCRIFSIPGGGLEKTLAGHTSIVTCCAATNDDTLIVTGSNDTTVRIWKRDGAEAHAVLEGSRTEIGAVTISPDNLLLAAGGADTTIRLWLLPCGEPAGEFLSIFGKVTALAFDPGGCIVVAGYDSGICAFYAVHGRKLIRTIAAHSGAVTGIVISAGERIVITSGEDGLVHFHPLPVAALLSCATLADMPAVRTEADAARGGPDASGWEFLYRLLAARFRGEIQICPSPGVIGRYDIQIAG